MKNGIVSLNLFTALDEIRAKGQISDGKWAEASGLKYASRVAELRWMAKLDASGDSYKVKRAFTFNKLTALIRGLQTILGDDMVNKELLKKGKKAKTELEQTLFNLMAVSDDVETVAQINQYIQMAIRAHLNREKKAEKVEP